MRSRNEMDRDRGVGGAGGGRHVPPKYFENYKDLVRKSVLCPPSIESLMVPLPNLKVAPRSLMESVSLSGLGSYRW